MAEEFDGEKTEEPSQHRIEEFRKRGEVASSRELTGILVLAGSLLTLGLSMTFILEEMSTFMEWLYKLDVATAFGEKALKTITTKTMMTAVKCAAPVALSALCIGVIAQVAQVGFLFAPEVIEMKFERLDPIGGMKKIFSLNALVETIKGLIKFTLIIAIVYVLLRKDIFSYTGFLEMEVFQSYSHAKMLLFKVAFSLILGLGVVAILDFAYVKFTYHQKLKQTKQELKQESKEQEGNPEIKQRIRQIQREMSRKRMMKDVKTADVIVTNPTHISVALKYDSNNMVSPQVIAKGADFLAMRIRELAKENGVPVVENVQLARTLYKTVKVGQPVPRNLYKAVAEVLAFVYKLKKKEKALQ